jgi:FAD dependent oxidoreductase TIGR03364
MKQSFDLIVVGGGVLGTFHAYHAVRAGLDVLHIEKDAYPVNATVRNFGQVVPSGLGGKWFQLGLRSTEIYKSIQAEANISIRQNGTVYIASDEQEQQLIHELKSVMDNRGYPCSLLNKTQTIEKWSALRESYVRESIFFPNEVSAEPTQTIGQLQAYIKSKFSNYTNLTLTTAVDCEEVSGGVKLLTHKKEVYTAKRIIVCSGAEFKILFPDFFAQSGIVVSKLQMMRTTPMADVKLEGNILTGLSIRRYESFTELPSFNNLKTPDSLAELKQWGIHILFKKGIDGSIIIGDSHEYASASQSDDLGYRINNHINELMLKEASRIVDFDIRSLTETWAGFYPQHPTQDIVEKDITDRIHIRTAIGGKGMTSSAGYAEQSIEHLI